jgi:hypothetical protein
MARLGILLNRPSTRLNSPGMMPFATPDLLAFLLPMTLTLPPDPPDSGNQENPGELTGAQLFEQIYNQVHSELTDPNRPGVLTSTTLNSLPPLPPAIMELTLEQQLSIETLRRQLKSEEFQRKRVRTPEGRDITSFEFLIDNFVAMARQNLALANNVKNLVRHWPTPKPPTTNA